MKKIFTLVIMLELSLAIAAGLARTLQAQPKDTVKSIELPVMAFDLADGPNRDKAAGFCAVCHGVEYIPMQPKLSKAQWSATVMKMVKTFGAPIPQEDADRIIEYLSDSYGTGK
ncbi:MAG: cytochrome C [Nitrospirae bacterium]|nr:cytochrome C [Nitrospirota bacterium]NTW65427.1 cytochrome C [Nitrospirota bacterium]